MMVVWFAGLVALQPAPIAPPTLAKTEPVVEPKSSATGRKAPDRPETLILLTPAPTHELRPSPGSPGLRNMAEVFTADDYPIEALRAEQQGNVLPKVSVDADGRVTGCTIVQSSNVAALDAVTCRLLTSRGRFDPARDPAGRPIAGHWSNRVRWVLPDPPPMPFRDLALSTVVEIKPDGTPGRCTAESPNVARDSCPYALEMASSGVIKRAAGPRQAGRKIVFELGTLVGDAESLATSARAIGADLIFQRAVVTTIDGSGTVTDCGPSPADLAADGRSDSLCAVVSSQRIEPAEPSAAGADRRMTHFSRVYLRD